MRFEILINDLNVENYRVLQQPITNRDKAWEEGLCSFHFPISELNQNKLSRYHKTILKALHKNLNRKHYPGKREVSIKKSLRSCQLQCMKYQHVIQPYGQEHLRLRS